MKRQRFASVWDALEDTAAAAANMQARSKLMIAMRSKIESWKVSQTEAARRLGLTQPRLNDLMRGRIDKFSLDALINLARPAGLVGPPQDRGSRLTLRRYRLHAHHWLILHGRYTCVARRPLCEKCPIADLCKRPGKTVLSAPAYRGEGGVTASKTFQRERRPLKSNAAPRRPPESRGFFARELLRVLSQERTCIGTRRDFREGPHADIASIFR